MRALTMPNEDVNTAAYNAISQVIAIDSKVHYIDTTKWKFTLRDNIHPDAAGHEAITDYLKSILQPYVIVGDQTVTPGY